MVEDFDPLKTDSSIRLISNRSILIAMAILVIVATAGGFVYGGMVFGFGVLLGGVLSFLNYFWLERSTRAIFSQVGTATTGILAVKYILRYFVIGLALFLVYITGAIPVAAVILGLSVFAFAVVIQGLRNIFSGSLL